MEDRGVCLARPVCIGFDGQIFHVVELIDREAAAWSSTNPSEARANLIGC
jgi:hypothetical protein